jgi:hypothetical protein
VQAGFPGTAVTSGRDNVAIAYEAPEILDYGSITAHTFMPVPPGCTPGIPVRDGGCASHKGFFNPGTPDGSDAELSHGVAVSP